jgi:carbonic anhydrase
MKAACSTIALALAVTSRAVNAAGGGFNYDQQELWPQSENECARENASGVGQSPIDVPPSECTPNTEGIVLNSGDCTLADLKFTQNNHGVKASFVGDCVKPTAVLPDYPDLVFEAAQFHIHTGCEHKVGGEGCDAEMHIVHFSTDTDLTQDISTYKAAVIGMMVDKNALEPHPTFDSLLDCWSETHNNFVETCDPEACDVSRRNLETDATCGDGLFDVYSLIPSGSGYYHYMGGLTTPPCSEIVRWNLMDTKVEVSLLQWTKLANAIINYGGYVNDDGTCAMEHTVASKTGSTSRETQAILGREVQHSCNAIL